MKPTPAPPSAKARVAEPGPKSQPIDLGVRSRPYVAARDDDEEDGRIRYTGGEVPAGFRVDTRVKKGLVIPGSIMLGTAYTISLMVTSTGSNCLGDAAVLQIVPVLGSAIWGFGSASCNYIGSAEQGSRAMLGMLGTGVQAAGLAMLIAGIAKRDKFLVPDESEIATNGLSWTIVAGTETTGQGLSIAGRF